jgi:hypothetical protein
MSVKTIVARSFAYIGHILTKRESLVQSGEKTFELSKNPEFNLYLQNPLEALSKAYCLKPNDISVLNSYGRSLWNRIVTALISSSKPPSLYGERRSKDS